MMLGIFVRNSTPLDKNLVYANIGMCDVSTCIVEEIVRFFCSWP